MTAEEILSAEKKRDVVLRNVPNLSANFNSEGCSGCSRCSDCSNCSSCYGQAGKRWMVVDVQLTEAQYAQWSAKPW